MNSAYNFKLFIKATFSCSLECPLYTGLTVFEQSQSRTIPLNHTYGTQAQGGHFEITTMSGCLKHIYQVKMYLKKISCYFGFTSLDALYVLMKHD